LAAATAFADGTLNDVPTDGAICIDLVRHSDGGKLDCGDDGRVYPSDTERRVLLISSQKVETPDGQR
jgi:hypothetical protein